MSSLAGPSTHASYSSLSTHPQRPFAISTKLRRVADVDSTPSSATTPATTVPPTPIVRAQSVAETEGREQSQDRHLNGKAEDGAEEHRPPEQRRPEDVKASIIADLDAVRARTNTLSRKHGRTVEEEGAMLQTAVRVAERLAEDQRAALFPDVDTPFVDEVDVVKRLLPYHIFQQPKEDLEAMLQSGSPRASLKGKRKATEEDLLREEIADTKFAIQCWKRRRALERRFQKARIDSGKARNRASPDDQAYILAQAMLEVERADTAALQQELRAARHELDKLEREKRLAAPPPAPAPAPPAPVPNPAPTPAAMAASRPAMNIRTANYYSSSAASTTSQTPTTATFMPPYRPYSYSYSQYPTTQYTYNPHAYNATAYGGTTTPYGSTSHSTTTASTPTYTPPASSVSAASSTSSASTQVQQAQAHPSSTSNTAVPVQLPVSSLNALSALGIVPVAASAVSTTGPPPQAVIKSTNGSTLNLEINLSLLQAAQMSGLALILNALTSRGVNVDGSSSAAGSVTSNPFAAVPTATPAATSSYGTAGVSSADTVVARAAQPATNSSVPAASPGSASPPAPSSAVPSVQEGSASTASTAAVAPAPASQDSNITVPPHS
ncbi:hypothetical protein BN946_scf184979.g12 [Trametes cinnabarina]|uniref:GLTSCR protein conserved domain-containing protein n=1 Tax=Pycnoporus cinnabarinus TaxID=5643 RepID=A0A060SIX4_PYCCI|nr:hypothetical protein BN946_scf184979.g12 [Trametes cinnabarina]